MYSQSLVNVVEPIKRTTVTRMNRGKKWKYGYNKEHDIIVISKTGKIGQIYEIQNLKIALPSVPLQVHGLQENKWKKIEYPKELSKLKNIFDWRSYPEEAKDKWYDYISFEIEAEQFGQKHWKRWFSKFKKENLF